jgi:hypothetical protein
MHTYINFGPSSVFVVPLPDLTLNLVLVGCLSVRFLYLLVILGPLG